MRTLFLESLALVIAGTLFLCCGNGGAQLSDGQDASNNENIKQNEAEPGAIESGEIQTVSKPEGGARDDVPFSGSKADIMKRMQQVPGIELRVDTATSFGEGLSYRGGRFGGFAVADWSFRFLKGQMIFSQINFSEQISGVKGDSIYTKLTSFLHKWYGKPVLNSDIAITSLSAYTEPEQRFIGKVGGSLYGDFQLWSVGESTSYVATLNKVRWNEANDESFVHLAFYDRAQTEEYFRQMETGNN